MDKALGCLVILVSLALLLVSLRNLGASPSRFGIVSGWVAMALFASMAAFAFGQAVRLQRAQRSDFYELPTATLGSQEVVLRRPGMLRGYCARFLSKEDRKPPPSSTLELLRACPWEIPGQPVAAFFGKNAGFLRWESYLFNEAAPDETIVLRYRVTETTRPVLSQVLLEVTCHSGEVDGVNTGVALFRTYMIAYLLALLISASGVTLQRRRMRVASRGTRTPTAVS